MSISRRALLQALGLSMAAGPLVVFAQEPAPGRGRAQQAPRDTTPLVPPF